MVLPGLFFVTTRLTQLFFLIPIIGMLSYFVHGYVQANFLTPNFVLVLFIVSVIAGVWALATLLFYGSAKHNGYLLAFIDICIWGGLIAGVYELGPISGESCSNFDTTSNFYVQLYVFDYTITKTCNMLKACFALAIIEILLFFWSVLLGLWVHHQHRNDRVDDGRRRSSEKHHSSRHSQRDSRQRSRSRPRDEEYGRPPYERQEPRPPRGVRGSSRAPGSNYGGSRR